MAKDDEPEFQKDLAAALKAKLHNSTLYNKLIEKNVKLIREEADLEESLLKISKKQEALAKRSNSMNADALEAVSDHLSILKGIVKAEQQREKIARRVAAATDAVGGKIDEMHNKIKALPGGELLSKWFNFEGLGDKMKKGFGDKLEGVLNRSTMKANKSAGGIANMGKMGGKSFKLMTAGARMFGVALGIATAGITIIIGLIVMLSQSIFEADSQIVDMARDLGISRDAAQGMYENFNKMTVSSKLAGANVKAFAEAQSQLSDAFATTAQFSQEQLESQIFLTKHMGLQAEEAVDLKKLADERGISTKQLTSEMLLQVDAINKQTGLQLSGKKVIQDVFKVSKNTRALYSGNTKELIKQVASAKALHSTLDEMAAISDGLLDIENSLANEMEARVMTGKNINLDKARELALNNDIAGATTAMLDQVGGIHEFNKMDKFQKESVATAMGMQLSQMEEMLLAQEEQKRLGVDLTALSADSTDAELARAAAIAEGGSEADAAAAQAALDAIEQQKMQEKMAEMWDKVMAALNPILVALMTVLTPVLEAVGWLLENLILPAINLIVGAISGIINAFVVVGGYVYDYLVEPIMSAVGMIGDAFSAVAEFINAPFIAIGETITGIWEGITAILKSPFNLMISGLNFVIAGLNTLSFDIPDWVPLIGGQTWGFDIAKIPHLATGGTIAQGGAAVVGERGPEIVDLPTGSSVFSNEESQKAGGGGGSAGVVAAIQEQNKLLTQMLSLMAGPTVIKIGNKTVEEIGSTISAKKNMTLGLDNTYGNTL